MKYTPLEIEEFGRHLIATDDLDPVYVALHNAMLEGSLDEGQLRRWLVAYWCFYSVGLASWMAQIEGRDFWKEMMKAAVNEEPTPLGGRWPRGHERRHFRGHQGTSAIAALQERYGSRPEQMVDHCALGGAGGSFKDVMTRVREHRMFGPWIAFKIADMLERLRFCEVGFDEAAVFMFKDPEKSAFMLWEHRHPEMVARRARPKRERVLHDITEHLRGSFSDFTAPPLHDRPVGIQEVETVLCKWKSHRNGHYPLGNDTRDIRESLEAWAERAGLAEDLLKNTPKPEES